MYLKTLKERASKDSEQVVPHNWKVTELVFIKRSMPCLTRRPDGVDGNIGGCRLQFCSAAICPSMAGLEQESSS